jgi:nucleotide-binding universal stress UspA family protein
MTTAPELRIRHVLVPLDGSEFASAALSTGRALAREFNAELHTLSLRRARPRGLRARVEAIARRVEELGACVVCVASHGRGRVLGAALGSLHESLLRRTAEPIVVVGPFAERPSWSPSPHWPPPLSHRRIVACVDGTTASEVVIPTAMAWARELDLEVTIVTVADDGLPSVLLDPPVSRYGRGSNANGYIEALVGRWQGGARAVTGRVVMDPIGPAAGIQAYLYERPTGLVAVATAVRSGGQRIVHGATASTIVRASIAPCLVVPIRETSDLVTSRSAMAAGA